MPKDTDDYYDNGKTMERCPECGKGQVWKDGRWGTRFLGCLGYPTCVWSSFKDKAATKARRAAFKAKENL